jgi:hypothetical protein
VECANEHFVVWDDFHANFASYIEDKHFEDGVGIPNKLP